MDFLAKATAAGLDGSSLSRWGWIAVGFGLAVYLVSVLSLGRWSFAHGWLFSRLVVLTPTESSLARIVGLPESPKHEEESTVSSLDQARTPLVNNKRKRPLETARERLDALELSQTTLQPGAIALKALKRRDATKLWNTLDRASVFGLSCIFSLLLRWILSWYKTWKKPCCSDIDCWVLASRALGKSDIVLSVLVIAALHSWWRLTLAASQRPEGFHMAYRPNACVTGFVMGTAVWWATGRSSPTLFQPHEKVQQALEELAVRCLLWFRLFGCSVDESLVRVATTLLRGLLAVICGCVGFGLEEPVHSLQQAIAYRWYVGDMNAPTPKLKTKGADGEGADLWNILRQDFTEMGTASLIVMPILILLLNYNSSMISDPITMPHRAFAAWFFVLTLFALGKRFQQDYLYAALPAVAMALEIPDRHGEEISNRITYPFASRYKSLMRHGSRLASLPLLLTILLTVCHLSCSPHLAIYPTAYGGFLMDEGSVHSWEEDSVLLLSKQALDRTDLLAPLSPNRANTCGQPLHVPEELESHNEDAAVLPTTLDLLSISPPSKTLIGTLRKLQLLSRESREAVKGEIVSQAEASAAKEAMDDCLSDLHQVLKALMLHPFLTRSAIFPIAIFVGVVLCWFWLITSSYTMLRGRKSANRMRAYSFQLAGTTGD